eukprot:1100151-Amphidinium_carterae.1
MHRVQRRTILALLITTSVTSANALVEAFTKCETNVPEEFTQCVHPLQRNWTQTTRLHPRSSDQFGLKLALEL